MKVIANTRTTQGTGASRRLRHAGKVPGVIYGGKAEVQAIEVEHNPLFHALRRRSSMHRSSISNWTVRANGYCCAPSRCILTSRS
jgi:ribosomal protein L25 (general stress protein Ctc)